MSGWRVDSECSLPRISGQIFNCNRRNFWRGGGWSRSVLAHQSADQSLTAIGGTFVGVEGGFGVFSPTNQRTNLELQSAEPLSGRSNRDRYACDHRMRPNILCQTHAVHNAAAPPTPSISFAFVLYHPQTHFSPLHNHSSAAMLPSSTLQNAVNYFPPLAQFPVEENKSGGFFLLCCLDAGCLEKPRKGTYIRMTLLNLPKSS